MTTRRHLFAFIWLFAAAAICSAQSLASPVLTEVEQLRRENLALKSQLHAALAERDACRVQFAPIRFKFDQQALDAEAAKLKADIEAAHPGFVYHVQTGALEPKPPAEPEKK